SCAGQRAARAGREAGREGQRLAGWGWADADQQRTEPIPAVPAMKPAAAGLAAPQLGEPARRRRWRTGQHPGPGPARPRRGGRAVLVGAVACVALLAVAVAGIVITG